MWFRLNQKIRFLGIAIANNMFRYITFACLVYIFSDSHYQIWLFTSWIISSVSAFFALKHFVFLTKGNHLKEYIKSLTTLSFAYLLNTIILWFFVQILQLNILLSQAVSLSIITINNYFMFKHFAFK